MKQVPYKAPDFSLKDSNTGSFRSLADFRGKWLVLYFYPGDFTPGCITESCSLRDARHELTELGAEVVGISKDAPDSHERFKAKYSLNFSLLSDPEGKTVETYGAWGKKLFGLFGLEGVLRKTFIINPGGEVVRVFEHVNPIGHGETIVNELKRLQNS